MIKPLKEFASDVTSQFGEDGILEEIFKRIGYDIGICVEFGAWDGIHFSNTWNLWHEKGWEAILIEGDGNKVHTLRENVASLPNVKVVKCYVEDEGGDSLDNILNNCNLTKNIDLLSIDVDGNDYYIFKSMVQHSPRVVIIEMNPTIPPWVDAVGNKDSKFGASALSLYNLAREKGYRLVACTQTNLVFVIDEDFKKMEMQEPSLTQIMPTNNLTYIVSSYEGETFLTRHPTYAKINKINFVNLAKQFFRSILGKKVLFNNIDGKSFSRVRLYKD